MVFTIYISTLIVPPVTSLVLSEVAQHINIFQHINGIHHVVALSPLYEAR
jgi:hypothetical protein